MYPSIPSASGSSMRVAQASPARGRPVARCHEVVIRLPGAISFHGDGGAVSGSVQTNLTPGDYGIRYNPRTKRFEVTPWPSKKQVLNVSLGGGRSLYHA